MFSEIFFCLYTSTEITLVFLNFQSHILHPLLTLIIMSKLNITFYCLVHVIYNFLSDKIYNVLLNTLKLFLFDVLEID